MQVICSGFLAGPAKKKKKACICAASYAYVVFPGSEALAMHSLSVLLIHIVKIFLHHDAILCIYCR